MDYKQVRKGVTNAEFNEDNSNIMFAEFAIIAVIIGLLTRSWWWGGGSFLSMIIALFIKPLAIVLVVVLSLCWAAVGYVIGAMFSSTGAMVVLSIIGFLAGIGVHWSALEWAEDITTD